MEREKRERRVRQRETGERDIEAERNRTEK